MAEEYLDEVVLKFKKQRSQEHILKVIRENGLPEDFFQTVSIGEGLAEINIPHFFQDMPQEWINRKYTNDPQPQIIKTNKNMSVDFTISVLDVAIPSSELKENVEMTQKGLLRILPAGVFYKSGQEEVQGVSVCWYSYMNTTSDNKKMYNMNFFAALEKVVMITMACDIEQMQNCEAIAMYCIHTLKGRADNGQERGY